MPPLPPRKQPRRKPGKADQKKTEYTGKRRKKEPDPKQNGKKLWCRTPGPEFQVVQIRSASHEPDKPSTWVICAA